LGRSSIGNKKMHFSISGFSATVGARKKNKSLNNNPNYLESIAPQHLFLHALSQLCETLPDFIIHLPFTKMSYEANYFNTDYDLSVYHKLGAKRRHRAFAKYSFGTKYQAR
jgi:hypothetical protein